MLLRRWYMVKIFCLLWCLTVQGGSQAMANDDRHGIHRRGVMDNFNEGLKFAGQMFGINTAADVANLVAKAFSPAAGQRQRQSAPSSEEVGHQASSYYNQEEQPPPQQQQTATQDTIHAGSHSTSDRYEGESNNNNGGGVGGGVSGVSGIDFSSAKLITSVLRMIGFDASKLGALAVQALLMIAQAIGNSLISGTNRDRVPNAGSGHPTPSDTERSDREPDFLPPEHRSRETRSGSPLDWFLATNNRQVQRLLDDMTDSDLTERLTRLIAHDHDRDDTAETSEKQSACLKMLMCKTSPLIWGMQKSLKESLGQRQRTANGTTAGKESKDSSSDAGGVVSEETSTTQSTAANEHTNDRRSRRRRAFSTEPLFEYLPSIEEFRQHGFECDKRYGRHCNTKQLNEVV